jgi:hypothetical protein
VSRAFETRRARLLAAAMAVALAAAAGLTLAWAQQRRARPSAAGAGTEATQRGPRTINVGARGDFQRALADARPGDTIVLEAGATYTGPFTLPFKQGAGSDADWITVRGSAEERLPAPGVRVTPAHAPHMPKIVSPGRAEKAVQTAARAHHYRFVGVEFAPANAEADVRNIVWLGEYEHALEEMPRHITLDRCYVHGLPTSKQVRGVALNGAHLSIVNSHVSEIHHDGQDSQAVMGWFGPGPYLIENNYLEAAGENVMFGGGDPRIDDLVPSDIVIRRNHFTKPLSWRPEHPSFNGRKWVVKNLLELKNARRVVIEGNLFENSWLQNQTGVALLLKGTNQDGRATWSVCEDVAVRHNVIRHVGTAIQLAKEGNSQGTRRVQIVNNLAYDISRERYSPGQPYEGSFLGTQIDADEVTVEHNTVADIDHKVARVGDDNYPKHRGLTVRNNVWMRGRQMGWGLEAASTEGVWAFEHWGSEWSYEGNVMFGPAVTNDVAARYPRRNFFTNKPAQDIFVNPSAGNYRLRPGSPYKGRATTGRDPGCDIDALEAAMSSNAPATAPPAPTERPRRVSP